jgi:hypothetical protein
MGSGKRRFCRRLSEGRNFFPKNAGDVSSFNRASLSDCVPRRNQKLHQAGTRPNQDIDGLRIIESKQGIRLQGGVRFPTGGESPRAPVMMQGQQIW